MILLLYFRCDLLPTFRKQDSMLSYNLHWDFIDFRLFLYWVYVFFFSFITFVNEIKHQIQIKSSFSITFVSPTSRENHYPEVDIYYFHECFLKL